MKMKLFPRIAGYGIDDEGKFTISVRDFDLKIFPKFHWSKITKNNLTRIRPGE